MLTAPSLLLLMLMGPPAQGDAATQQPSVVDASPEADAQPDSQPEEAPDSPTPGDPQIEDPSPGAPPAGDEGDNLSKGPDEGSSEDSTEGTDTQVGETASEPTASEPAPSQDTPVETTPVNPDTFILPAPVVQERWLHHWFHQCLPQTQPCYRSHRARGLLFAAGALSTISSVALIFSAGDRNRLGDPAMAMTGAGIIAMGAATIGATAAAIHADGPALFDRITPPTLGLALGLGGSDHTDEAVPYRLSGTFAPTFRFPRGLGRARLVGRVGGDLGSQLERDPRPQLTEADQFPVALDAKGWSFDLGLDLAFGLPYPVAKRDDRGHIGQFELRYKPLFFFARDTLTLGSESGGEGEQRISQRVALTPLNFGLRWNLSPRQRFTFYLGPRWDLIAHGEPGAVATSAPALAPIYGEAWFDIDLPLRKLARAQERGKPSVVSQFTIGYVHSRFYGSGINFGSVVGFLGNVIAQYAVRIRPLGSPVAYQFSAGATVGDGLSPFLRLGIVMPDIGAKP